VFAAKETPDQKNAAAGQSATRVFEEPLRSFGRDSNPRSASMNPSIYAAPQRVRFEKSAGKSESGRRPPRAFGSDGSRDIMADGRTFSRPAQFWQFVFDDFA
jgi:hypothetical protein